jgi:hypothetical protein
MFTIKHDPPLLQHNHEQLLPITGNVLLAAACSPAAMSAAA